MGTDRDGLIDAALPDDLALQILARSPFSLVLADPNLPDTPIVYVNDAFERATGYSRAVSVGRNCRFLQGEATDRRTVDRLRAALRDQREITIDILNYRADGAPFWNRLMIAPLYAADGRLQYFIGIQKLLGAPGAPAAPGEEAPDLALREIQHRVKNHLSMIVAMIRLQSRGLDAADQFDTLARRVESLQLLYDELSGRGGENRDAVALGAYLGRVANAVAHLDGRPGVRVNIDVEAFTVPMETAVRLGLIVSEAMTNALQHGFVGRDEGLVTTRVHEAGDGGILVEIVDDGIGAAREGGAPAGRPGLGSRLIAQLAAGLDARLDVESGPGGTSVSVAVPPSARGGG